MTCSIDDLLSVLEQTVLSIKGSWSVLFGVLFLQKFHVGVLSKLCCAFAIAVTLTRALIYANRAYVSWPLRKLDNKRDVVLISGGSSGLGLLLAAMFATNGFKVAMFSLYPPPITIGNVHFYRVDVSKKDAVDAAAASVRAALGNPTAVINCAGRAYKGSIAEISPEVLCELVNTNLLGGIWVYKAFIPEMVAAGRGYVVNLSSSTAFVGPRLAGAYACTKAAVRIYHESLRHELRGTGVKTLLVTPGQLDTKMFENVKTPSELLAPVLPASILASKIYDWMSKGWAGEIVEPLYARLLPFALLLPQSVVDLMREFVGMDHSMETFVNRMVEVAKS